MRITRVTIWVLGLINLLTKSPLTLQVGFGVYRILGLRLKGFIGFRA